MEPDSFASLETQDEVTIPRALLMGNDEWSPLTTDSGPDAVQAERPDRPERRNAVEELLALWRSLRVVTR
jgi:hypothetical protein